MSSPARTLRRRSLRRLAACPDCDSTVRVLTGTPFPQARVEHDDTCPWWRAHGSTAFREVLAIVKDER